MIVAGIGLRRDCSGDELASLVARAAELAGCEPELLAVPAFRAEAVGAVAAARHLALPLQIISPDALADAQLSCPTRSARAQAATGFASVAEGCALAGAGPRAVLLLARIASPNATCAIAATAGLVKLGSRPGALPLDPTGASGPRPQSISRSLGPAAA